VLLSNNHKNKRRFNEATKTNMINTKRNTDEKSNWKNQKANLKTAFPGLTDEDLNFDHDRKNEMLGKLAIKLGKTTPELVTVLEKTKS
jgi:hypothetical protein